MTWRAQLREDLKIDEGMSLLPYKCTAGKWTIGYGRNIQDNGISQGEADYLLTNDIRNIEAELVRKWGWFVELPQDAQRGLMNMAFNLGVPRLAGFKNMLAALEAHDFAEAAEQALDSKWAEQVGDRATRIANLYLGCL